MKKLSRAKRKILKQKLLKQKKPIDKQTIMTQAQIDEFFKLHKEKQQEQEAKRKMAAENGAFDNFIETGKLTPVEYFTPFERFLSLARLGPNLPEIDIDETNHLTPEDKLNE